MFKQRNKYSCFIGLVLCLLISAETSARTHYTLPSGEVLLDPTEPYGAKVKQKTKVVAPRPKLTLNYIIGSGESRRAMINGQKVRIGEKVAGMEVSKIASDSVSLVHGGSEFVLRLKKLVKIKK